MNMSAVIIMNQRIHNLNLAAIDHCRHRSTRIMSPPFRHLRAILTSLMVQGAGVFPGTAGAATTAADSPRVRQCFDAGWAFFNGDTEGADQRSFDHSAWRRLDLPQDWSIEGSFDAANPSGAPGGYLPCGTGWYRKSFKLPTGAAGRRVFIEFDGVYMNGEVWINGHRLGKRPYGYLGFEYDLTPHLDLAGDNVLAVRVDNSLQPSSRWYTGSGIYRHVWLTLTDKLRVAHWGTQVSTPKISAGRAEVAVRTTLRNGYDAVKPVTVTQKIIAADGKEVASTAGAIELAAGEERVFNQTLGIADPALWSPDSPNLYTVRTELGDGDRLTDRYQTPLGLREVRFDPARGLLLNGASVIKKGVCEHHDLGPLGAALWDQALERRLRLLKAMGCNAIRTAHNPPAPELLDLCNEVPEAQKHGELETLKQLQDLCHRLDPTRPVTVGVNLIAGANATGFADLMDVTGYNEGGGSCFQYEADHIRYPERRFYGSEVPHSLQTRGECQTRTQFREPEHQPPHLTAEEVFPETDAWYESSYDNAAVRISSRESWRLTKTLPFVVGEFRWTGFDFLGESGGWPRVIGNFVPKAAQWVTIELEGPGRIIGIGNGDPLSHESYQGTSVRTFNGLALAIIAPTGQPDKVVKPNSDRKPGGIILTARSRGLPPAELRISAQPEVSDSLKILAPSPDRKPEDQEIRPTLE